MNYRDLLRRYIKHVQNCEGVDYIENDDHGEAVITDADREALRQCADENDMWGTPA